MFKRFIAISYEPIMLERIKHCQVSDYGNKKARFDGLLHNMELCLSLFCGSLLRFVGFARLPFLYSVPATTHNTFPCGKSITLGYTNSSLYSVSRAGARAARNNYHVLMLIC